MADYDPLSKDVLADPYPFFAEFHASACPVHHHQLAKVDVDKICANPLVARPTTHFFSLFRHADVSEAVQHHEVFSSAEGPGPERLISMNGVGMLVYADPPHHTYQRRIVGKALSPRLVAQLEPRVRAIAHELVDAFPADGRVEFVKAFADALPGTVFSEWPEAVGRAEPLVAEGRAAGRGDFDPAVERPFSFDLVEHPDRHLGVRS